MPDDIDFDALELTCPTCEYALRGLREDRCPECGEPFDRETLTWWMTRRELPLRFTRRGEDTRLVLLESLFHPRRLGRELPLFPSTFAARRYTVLTRFATMVVLAAGVMTFTGAASGPAEVWVIIFLVAGAGFFMGSLACEYTLAAAFRATVRGPTVPTTRTFDFWLVLVQCFSGHLILTAALTMLMARTFVSVLLILPAGLVPLSWWFMGVMSAARQRGGPESRPVRMVLLGLAAVALAILVGIAAGFLTGAIVFRLFFDKF